MRPTLETLEFFSLLKKYHCHPASEGLREILDLQSNLIVPYPKRMDESNRNGMIPT